jgi:hypothetical protein
MGKCYNSVMGFQGLTRAKTLLIVCSLFVSGAAMFLLHPFTTGDSAGNAFRWVPANPGDRFVEVATGKKVVVPFEFQVGPDVREMSFDIKEESLRGKGVFIEGAVTEVRDGMASSRVVFDLRPGAGLRAGHYSLTVIARDAATGDIVRKGEIPFGVDIREIIWKCSC